MSSASIAKARLLAESVEQKKLAELKEVAAELGLSTAEVKRCGNLATKATWIEAINLKVAEIFGVGENSYHDQDSLAPEKPEGVSSVSLTEESMIAPEDSENFVESPIPPSSVPVEFPEDEPDDEPNWEGLEKIAIALDKADINFLLAQATEEDIETCSMGEPSHESEPDKADGYDDFLQGWKILPLAPSQPIPCINIFPENFDQFPQSGMTEERLSQIMDEADQIAEEHLQKHPWQPGEFEAMYPGSVEEITGILSDHTINECLDAIPFDGEDDWSECPKCDGFGYIGSNHDEICHHCYGEGLIPPDHTTNPLIVGKSSWQIATEINAGFDGCHVVGKPCETCNGTGLVPDFNGDGDEICPDCGGTGYSSEPPQSISINSDWMVGNETEASDFEKDTIVAFFKAEGMPENEIQELRAKPLSKLEASACLGFVDYYKKSASIALRCYLVDWVNDLAGDAERCFSRADQMNILFSWKFISEVKVKIAHHFQLREGEINCFITPDGYRVSVPEWSKEQILTPQETEFITTNDPVIEMFGNGYLFALEHFKEQVTVHQEVIS